MRTRKRVGQVVTRRQKPLYIVGRIIIFQAQQQQQTIYFYNPLLKLYATDNYNESHVSRAFFL